MGNDVLRSIQTLLNPEDPIIGSAADYITF